MPAEISSEIAEMVYEDLLMQPAAREELAVKVDLIMSLYTVIEALCKKFGECHLEQRQDDFALLRVFYNEECRQKGAEDTSRESKQ